MIGSVHCTFPLVKHCNWLFNSTQSQLFALCRFAVKGFVFFLVKPQCEYTDGPLCMSCSGMYTQQLNYYCKTMLKNSALELRARSALRACLESREFWDGVLCSIFLLRWLRGYFRVSMYPRSWITSSKIWRIRIFFSKFKISCEKKLLLVSSMGYWRGNCRPKSKKVAPNFGYVIHLRIF